MAEEGALILHAGQHLMGFFISYSVESDMSFVNQS